MTMITDVINFNRKFGIEGHKDGDLVRPLTDEEAEFKIKFLQEELDETKKAFEEGNIIEVVDGLLDIIYVAIGTLHLMDMSEQQIRDHWAEIQRANMSKERAMSSDDPRSKRKNSLDVVKPHGWVGPDHVNVFEIHENIASQHLA